MTKLQRFVYGLAADTPGLVGREPVEIGCQLRELGNDGVFLKTLQPDWVSGLRAAGLRVYASQAVFLAGDDLWSRFPDSHPLMADGQLAPVEEWYQPALPTSAELRAHRLGQLESLLTSLPLDGVWLDFIRWPARWERKRPLLYDSSFDPGTLRQFQGETGITIPVELASPSQIASWLLDRAAEAWFAWRCQQITSFVSAARQVLERICPEAMLGLFTVPWTGLESRWPGMDQAHIRIVAQDPAALSQHVDILSPMVYHRLCGRPVTWIGDVVGWNSTQADCPVWPIVEAIDPPPDYGAPEFAAACQAAEDEAEGLIVFKLDGLLADEEKVAVWRKISS